MSDLNSKHNRLVWFDIPVSRLGGKVLEPTHAIGPHGFRAVVLDSEGNRVALHSTADR